MCNSIVKICTLTALYFLAWIPLSIFGTPFINAERSFSDLLKEPPEVIDSEEAASTTDQNEEGKNEEPLIAFKHLDNCEPAQEPGSDDNKEIDCAESYKTSPQRTVIYDKTWYLDLLPKRISFIYNQGNGKKTGFGVDYSSIEFLFAPGYKNGQVIPLLDVRGQQVYHNLNAVNVGLALRYIPPPDSFCEILGFNMFYDYREGLKGSYQQLGLGMEVLGNCWEIRANGYIPIGLKAHETHCVFDDYVGDYFAIKNTFEFIYYGINAEAGFYPLRSPCLSFYAAAGPYYLATKDLKNARGGYARLRSEFRDYIALDFILSYDDIFRTLFQGRLIFTLPLYQIPCIKKRCNCCCPDARVYQRIDRFDFLPLRQFSCWQSNF